ncbi:MAG: DUF952 domain-containing protein [Bryobacterales bacterium]|nr:DUF952 domain-containing protein [Bryobacterales bacterium]
MILHVTSRAAWLAAQHDGAYRGDTLATEGFIHCCLPRQLDHVLRSYFQGRTDLVVLEIDEAAVGPEIRWEGEIDRFPHIYGALNTDAVVAVREISE